MATSGDNVQLKDFDANDTPVPADIVYCGNSADSYNEVKCTIEDIIAAYPGLSSIGSLTTAANQMLYTTDIDVYATAPITAFGRSVLALSAATTAPAAGVLAGWDANLNLSADSFLPGFVTQATASGTTTLTVNSKYIQEFTGTDPQTVQMPVTSTLVAGQGFIIINNSSDTVTVNSSGANLIKTLTAGTRTELVCVLTSGTTAASWAALY